MSEWQPKQSALEEASRMTPIMRSSSKPQWREVRDQLRTVGLRPEDAALTEFVTEGDANMGATLATRDGRVFDVMIVLGYTRDHRPVGRDEGFVSSFREVAPDGITTISSGQPNSWLEAALIARMILDEEAES